MNPQEYRPPELPSPNTIIFTYDESKRGTIRSIFGFFGKK